MAMTSAERTRKARLKKDAQGLCRICGVRGRKPGISPKTEKPYVNCGQCIDERSKHAPPKPLMRRKMTIKEADVIAEALAESDERDAASIIKSAMNRNFS